MTLFDLEQYHQPKKENYKRDWDGVKYDPAWDKFDDTFPIVQNKISTTAEASEVEEREEKKPAASSEDCWNTAYCGDQFGLPIGWTSPHECRAATELLELGEQSSEILSTPSLVKSSGGEYSTSTPSASVKEKSGEYSTTKSNTIKAVSLWQPWASLIPLGLKHYETRSWKTNYRGKLLICATLDNSKHYREYLKIKDNLQLPPWNEDNFPHGQAIAICDLVDCIEMTPKFIAQQSQTETLCGDWQLGRYAWKLDNIQPISEPFPIKGKQGLFNVPFSKVERYLNQNFVTSASSVGKRKSKSSDCWYTPPSIFELVVQVLGEITLDPCADDGKHLEARKHYTIVDDGLIQKWEGCVYMNPPFSHPGVWMKKLQSEIESGRVTEAIAIVPAATDTNWLSPVLEAQPVCFWKGRIKFLDKNYQPRQAARQSHVLVYWGKNWERFKEVFESHGVIYLPLEHLDGDKLNKFLLGDKQNSSPSNSPELNTSPSKSSPSNSPELNISPSKSSPSNSPELNISPSKSSPSNLLGDKESSPSNSPELNASPSKKRLSGEGNGYIHWRTITKNGKEYPQAYYHWKEGNKKRSKYIPKKLLGSVEEANSAKRPVIEILKLLGVKTSPSKLLGDEESSPSNNNANADISDSTEKLLGDKWINNGETNISQASQGSPSNLDTSPSKIELSPSKRRKGDGSGNIHWRTITRGGKDYPQAYYHYEFWSGGDRLTKSSKYISKRLLSQVQRLEAEKTPVKEILKILGIL